MSLRFLSQIASVLLLSLPLFAQTASLAAVPTTAPASVTGDLDAQADESHRWLYEKLFTEPVRNQFPDESFKSFRVHLKDSDTRFPDPAEIVSLALKPKPQIKGTITYVGIAKKKYLYDVFVDPTGTLVMQVRVHFKNPDGTDLVDFENKLKAAALIWNQYQVPMDFAYRFEFLRADSAANAHFSVNVLDTTRGPYDQNWARNWTAIAIAHEVGHMMGLGDEYQTLSGKTDCYRPSLMCESWTGAPMPHQYYFILRRLL